LGLINLKKYKTIYREEGFLGVAKKMGWPAAIALFLFFLLKGLAWIFIPILIAKGCF
jgi:hypothetical protein